MRLERQQQLDELTEAVIAAPAQHDLRGLLAAHPRVCDAVLRESRAAYAAFGLPYPVSEAADAALRERYEHAWPATLPGDTR